jgi:hypothetical protein
MFYLCHLHGNNYAPTFNYEGHDLPIVLELTFVPKALVPEATISVETFPTALDTPNNSNNPDINLDFI